jgi:hypothetical protein
MPDLSQPSVQALAYLLRHPELWPADFRFDFFDLDRCAIGLASELEALLVEC